MLSSGGLPPATASGGTQGKPIPGSEAEIGLGRHGVIVMQGFTGRTVGASGQPPGPAAAALGDQGRLGRAQEVEGALDTIAAILAWGQGNIVYDQQLRRAADRPRTKIR